MKDKILDIIREHPKLYTQVIRRNPILTKWVNENSIVRSDSFAEMIYSAVWQRGNQCEYGNTRKFAGVNKGYVGCGRTGQCACATKTVSEAVMAVKQQVDREQQQIINAKRRATTLDRYGCVNNGQLPQARGRHSNFYQDTEQVQALTQRIKNTKLSRYSDENYNNQQQIQSTLQKRFGVSNSLQLTESHANPLLSKLKDKSVLEQMYTSSSIDEIAEHCSVHVNTVYRYLQEHGIKDKYKSSFEQEIVNFINESRPGTEIITNSRKLISGEIDIYLPEFKLAIEFNGIWWHHDKIPHIDKSYHYRKFAQCEQLGIRLLTIFSDQWDNKKEIWKAKILSMMHKTPVRVFARKCQVVKLCSKEIRALLDKNHIQGYTNAEFCYGLMFENRLVAAMTFSKCRGGIGKSRGPNSYELIRYVTECSVVGGASKLLRAFVQEFSPAIIVSYSDNRYSFGELYDKLGFTLESENKFNYWYYDPKTKRAFHRYKYAKHNLVKMGADKTKTERQITDEMGLLRIWDCGTRTWVLIRQS
jgi:hypothetical protein